MIDHRKYLGLCELDEGGNVILYPGGRFMNGVPLTEHELQAERVDPSNLNWLRGMFGGALGVIFVKLAPPVFYGPFLIGAVLMVFVYLPAARYQRLRRKYPDRSWTSRTPFQREMAGELQLPKHGKILAPISVVGVALSIFGLGAAVGKPVTYANTGMIVALVFVLALSAAWLTYHLVPPSRRASSR